MLPGSKYNPAGLSPHNVGRLFLKQTMKTISAKRKTKILFLGAKRT